MTTGDALVAEAQRFAADLTATVKAVVGGHVEAFGARALHRQGLDHVSVRQEPRTGIPLTVDGAPLLNLTAEYYCVWDSPGQYLAVDESAVKVYAGAKAAGEPLVRYEYLRAATGGWRGDSDERLTEAGLTVGDALSCAARRSALVRGLLWRSHLTALDYSATVNRRLSAVVGAAGGQVLLDQRIRSRGSHHQKLVVIRHRRNPRDDVAFGGGIDLAHSRGDDHQHAGDPQTTAFSAPYGPCPAWHDVQVELRGATSQWSG
ncbi:phospholipase [Blastococcus saxobsidens]|uniref:Putative Phospholipase n=1 Tax=Blastococcus saxobsidens (strain DD2) TaxID=1146883 RepID=H6RMC1_BLASD|nr:phospholipase [Blastococcus saxobsidens]CCG02557.1 putative Phospholipase [Blastococcus saxobsidens DD2]